MVLDHVGAEEAIIGGALYENPHIGSYAVAHSDYCAEAGSDLWRSQLRRKPFNAKTTAKTIQAKVNSKTQSIHQSRCKVNEAGIASRRAVMYHAVTFLHLGRPTPIPRTIAYQKMLARNRWRAAQRKSKGGVTGYIGNISDFTGGSSIGLAAAAADVAVTSAAAGIAVAAAAIVIDAAAAVVRVAGASHVADAGATGV